MEKEFQVHFQPISSSFPQPEPSCVRCAKKAELEAIYGEKIAIPCCDNELCRQTASKQAIEIAQHIYKDNWAQEIKKRQELLGHL